MDARSCPAPLLELNGSRFLAETQFELWSADTSSASPSISRFAGDENDDTPRFEADLPCDQTRFLSIDGIASRADETLIAVDSRVDLATRPITTPTPSPSTPAPAITIAVVRRPGALAADGGFTGIATALVVGADVMATSGIASSAGTATLTIGARAAGGPLLNRTGSAGERGFKVCVWRYRPSHHVQIRRTGNRP